MLMTIVRDCHQMKKTKPISWLCPLNNTDNLDIDDLDTKADTANLFRETFYD
jgi:hypothetical protein